MYNNRIQCYLLQFLDINESVNISPIIKPFSTFAENKPVINPAKNQLIPIIIYNFLYPLDDPLCDV